MSEGEYYISCALDKLVEQTNCIMKAIQRIAEALEIMNEMNGYDEDEYY